MTRNGSKTVRIADQYAAIREQRDQIRADARGAIKPLRSQEPIIEDYSNYCSDCCWFECCRQRKPQSDTGRGEHAPDLAGAGRS